MHGKRRSVPVFATVAAWALASCTAGGSETALTDPPSETTTTAAGSTTTTSVVGQTTTSAADTATTTVSADDCIIQASMDFDEGAPTDSFTISNSSNGLAIHSVRIDLSSAYGNLVFDTEAGGSGVEVFQPFQTGDTGATLAIEPSLADGATSLALAFKEFGPGESFTFTTDLDDRLPNSELGQIQVTGGELAGATATFGWTVAGEEVTATAAFNESNQLSLSADCF